MKHILLFLLLTLSAWLSYGQATNVATKEPIEPKAHIQFTETSHDFDDIKQGDVVNYNYKFTNTGKSPLIIAKVQVTCGCTTPYYPKEPVLPGKTGEIKISFNSAGKVGRQNKVITILSNADNPEERVSLICNVLPPAN